MSVESPIKDPENVNECIKRKGCKRRILEEVKLFKCETCGKCFVRKMTLDRHIKIVHENIKDHTCNS